MSVKLITLPVKTNVPILGTGLGGKVLKDANGDSLIQFGEYSENDTSITSDNGGFVTGGAMYVADSSASFFYNTVPVFQAGVSFTRTQLSSLTQMSLTESAGDEFAAIVAKTKVSLGGANAEIAIAAPTGTVGIYGAAAVALQAGVAVTDVAIHAALVNLGLITA